MVYSHGWMTQEIVSQQYGLQSRFNYHDIHSHSPDPWSGISIYENKDMIIPKFRHWFSH